MLSKRHARTGPYPQVCTRLDELGVGALVVSADGLRVYGIVSERDVIHQIAQGGPATLERPVAEIMIRSVVTCQRSDNIVHLMKTMTERRIRHLPVVEDDQLIEIVSIGDVIKHRILDPECESHALREYIAS